jgi:hypothetical protein
MNLEKKTKNNVVHATESNLGTSIEHTR